MSVDWNRATEVVSIIFLKDESLDLSICSLLSFVNFVFV